MPRAYFEGPKLFVNAFFSFVSVSNDATKTNIEYGCLCAMFSSFHMMLSLNKKSCQNMSWYFLLSLHIL